MHVLPKRPHLCCRQLEAHRAARLISRLSSRNTTRPSTPRFGARPTTGRCQNVATADGTANFDQSAGSGDTLCRFFGAAGYDLTESSVSIELDAIDDFEPTWRAFLEAVDDSGTRVQLFFRDDLRCAVIRDSAGNDVASEFDTCISYNGQNRYWRLRADEATLYAEVSSNNTDFDGIDSIEIPIELDRVRIRFGTESSDLRSGIGLGIDAFNP